MAKSSIWHRVPYGKEFHMAKSSIWQRVPYGKEFHMAKSSICCRKKFINKDVHSKVRKAAASLLYIKLPFLQKEIKLLAITLW